MNDTPHMNLPRLTRRAFVAGPLLVAASLSLPVLGRSAGAEPLSVFSLPLDAELSSVEAQAAALGLAAPRASRAPASRSPALLSFYLGEYLDQALAKAAAGDVTASEFSDRVGRLISQLARSTRDPALADPSLQTKKEGPPFDQLQPEYKSLFTTCKINSTHQAELNSASRKILSADYQRRYRAVELDTRKDGKAGVPWYVIGALHYREANLNSMGHLHNGDYLKEKTTDYPPGRPLGPWPPVPWDAEVAWRKSAVDALQDYGDQEDWTLERILYTFERYNGWGYRWHSTKQSVHRSPYVWNYTDKGTTGGFPVDHKWDPNYVSKQAGLAAILKTLLIQSPDQIPLVYYA